MRSCYSPAAAPVEAPGAILLGDVPFGAVTAQVP
jgi:hypothetical protein